MIEQFLEVWKPIANQDFVYGLLQLESEIRVNQTTETIDDLVSILKERHMDDNAWCEYDINMFINEIYEVAEKMKEQNI